MRLTPFLDGPPAQAVGPPIELSEARATLTSATADDAAQIAGWLGDDKLAAPLGRAGRSYGAGEVAAWIGRFDRLDAHLLTARQDGTLPVGFATIHLDPASRVAWFDVIVGDRRRETQETMRDMARAIARWCFVRREMHKIVTQVAATNRRTAAFAGQAMKLEAELRDELLLHDGTRGTLLRFGMLKREWEARLAARMELPTVARQRPDA